MKNILFILLIILSGSNVFCQTDTVAGQPIDTDVVIKRAEPPKPIKAAAAAAIPKRKRVVDTANNLDTAKINAVVAVNSDSLHQRSSADTIQGRVKQAALKRPIDSFYRKLLDNPFSRSTANPIYLVINERHTTSKDEMFYMVLGLLLFLAFIKLVFSRYFQNLFRLFFQPSFRQKQTREQLQQGNLPSLLLNLFFICSAAAYISFLLHYYHVLETGFWLLFLYSSLSLLVLYTGKYIFLTFAGWVFNVKEATDTYIFAIYLINKILGVVLVPFTLIIAFSYASIINVSITISILVIFLLFLYRYLVSYAPVRKEVKVSPLHFFFYVFAFEITPLLLIYKTLMLYLHNSL